MGQEKLNRTVQIETLMFQFLPKIIVTTENRKDKIDMFQML